MKELRRNAAYSTVDHPLINNGEIVIDKEIIAVPNVRNKSKNMSNAA